jgi:uncharacterized CHY-type Zn-finger protein
MRIVSVADHQTPDGKMDWKSYNAASEAARRQDINDGVYCSSCGAYLIFNRGGGRQRCGQCRGLSEPGELTHDRLIRCPACGDTFNPGDNDHYKLYGDGEHSVTCQNCDHQFEVSTHISYSFTSPPRISPAEDDEEPEEEQS